MEERDKSPQLSLMSIATILSMAFAGTWALFQTQLSSIEHELTRMQDQLHDVQERQIKLISSEAHEPVEKATIDANNVANDKRIDLIQGQITDINRQIAAALIIIDNNSGVGVATEGKRSGAASLPP